jgi:hypothetical protein
MDAQPVLHRFTVEEYESMAKHGIISDRPRLELLAGEIVEMSPIGPPHGACVDRLTRLFVLGLVDRAIVHTQGEIRLMPDSMPQPDLALFAPEERFYEKRHARVDEILLVIEVADSSLAIDRRVKLPIYASHGIPEYWIVDLRHRKLERYRDPAGRAYASTGILGKTDTVSPLAFPDLVLPLAEIIPD